MNEVVIFLISLFSRKASFEQVKSDYEALTYHYSRYRLGERDLLAIQCFQFIMSKAQEQPDD